MMMIVTLSKMSLSVGDNVLEVFSKLARHSSEHCENTHWR